MSPPRDHRDAKGANRQGQAYKENVRQQVVAGFVIFRRTREGIKYLLLYKRGQYWNFPKGHFEPGEDALQTALRETEEETGMTKADLHIVPGFRAYERFFFRAGGERVHDTVILHLAETKKEEVRIATREHSGFGWFTYHDAVNTVGKKYVATKRVLRRAHDFLRSRQKSRPGGKGLPPRHGASGQRRGWRSRRPASQPVQTRH